jgi:hypothetical protein
MDYQLLLNKMKTLEQKHSSLKQFVDLHANKIGSIKIQKLPINDNHNCTSKCCPKKASYRFNNSYYCWFHRIDFTIHKNNSIL